MKNFPLLNKCFIIASIRNVLLHYAMINGKRGQLLIQMLNAEMTVIRM